MEKPSEDNGFVIKKWCFVETTDMVLVLLSGPIIMILLASFFAFREQNHPQAFYERKFLTFGCLNVSLLLIAVELGYKFISSYHAYILLCFGNQMTGIIFLGCFIVPRIYVGVMRSRHGEHVFHLEEHNNVDQQKKCSSRKLDHNLKETQLNKENSPSRDSVFKKVKEVQRTVLNDAFEVTLETPEVKIKEFLEDVTNCNDKLKTHNGGKINCNDSPESSDLSVSVSSIGSSLASDEHKTNALSNPSDERKRLSLVNVGRQTIYDEKETIDD